MMHRASRAKLQLFDQLGQCPGFGAFAKGWSVEFHADPSKLGAELALVEHPASRVTFRQLVVDNDRGGHEKGNPISCWNGAELQYILDFRGQRVVLPERFRDRPAVLEHVLADDIFPRILAHERVSAFHMSGARIGRTCVGFCGRSGRGKSTLAAAFMRAGQRPLSDDCLVLTSEAKGVTARGLWNSMRLWPGTFDAVLGDTGLVSRAAGPAGKLRVDIETGGNEPAGQLAAVYFLEDRPDAAADEVWIEPMSPSEACGHLVRHSFGIDLWSVEWKMWLLETCAATAEQVPAFSLAYPRRFDFLPEVVDCLVARHSAHSAPSG